MGSAWPINSNGVFTNTNLGQNKSVTTHQNNFYNKKNSQNLTQPFKIFWKWRKIRDMSRTQVYEKIKT